MILFDRFYVYALMMLAVMAVLMFFKPLLLLFMFVGLAIIYVSHYLIKHPALSHLLARVAAESIGLLLMLAIFVSLMVAYAHILNV